MQPRDPVTKGYSLVNSYFPLTPHAKIGVPAIVTQVILFFLGFILTIVYVLTNLRGNHLRQNRGPHETPFHHAAYGKLGALGR